MWIQRKPLVDGGSLLESRRLNHWENYQLANLILQPLDCGWTISRTAWAEGGRWRVVFSSTLMQSPNYTLLA